MLTQSGLEVSAITTLELVRGGFKDLIIGQVVTCQQHPNANKLKITQVDVGQGTPLLIVCGAPNIAIGQKVVVAPVGAQLCSAKGDLFRIKRTKIRGEISEGMICAEDEIGLGNMHEGILVLDTILDPGTPVAEHFDYCVDTVFEVDVTPNRGDACSHIGVARELAVLLNRPVQYPTIDHFRVDPDPSKRIKVNILDAQACPRYAAAVIKDVVVQESPAWIQSRLKSIGIAPVNNIVDVTNFVMHELGQPLHAFDYDQIDGQMIAVQRLSPGTEFVTLDGKSRVLTGDELMICDQRGGLCMAGILGGKRGSIQAGTQNIFLE
ncbi:MAG: YtpR family tRNA-binding protein, partial [Bacteroidota bacterium]